MTEYESSELGQMDKLFWCDAHLQDDGVSSAEAVTQKQSKVAELMRDFVHDGSDESNEAEPEGRSEGANNGGSMSAVVEEVGRQIQDAESVSIGNHVGQFVDEHEDEEGADGDETILDLLVMRALNQFPNFRHPIQPTLRSNQMNSPPEFSGMK